MFLLSLLLACAPGDADDGSDPPTSDDPADTTPEDTEPTAVDADDDGHASVESGGDDCDDADPSVHPGAPEVWYDGVDQACNGMRDDADQDGDGHGAVAQGGDDCNDRDPRLTTEENAFESISPRDGARDVLPTTPIEIQLRDADPRATLEVVANGAVVVPGTFSIDNRTLSFVPVTDWPPDTELEVTVRSMCSSLTTSFSTSQLGQPVADLEALVGASFKLDVRTGVVTQPPVFGSLILGSVTGWEVLTVTGVVGDQLQMRFSYAERRATAQDPCLPAIDLPRAMDLSGNPYVSMEPDAQWYLGRLADPGDSVLTGLMRPDGSEIVDATWSIYTDLRDVYDLFRAGTAQQVCTILGTSGFQCSVCADGVQTCLETRIENLELVRAPFDLVERLPEDILADPACTP